MGSDPLRESEGIGFRRLHTSIIGIRGIMSMGDFEGMTESVAVWIIPPGGTYYTVVYTSGGLWGFPPYPYGVMYERISPWRVAR
jgi:hypothetical protein